MAFREPPPFARNAFGESALLDRTRADDLLRAARGESPARCGIRRRLLAALPAEACGVVALRCERAALDRAIAEQSGWHERLPRDADFRPDVADLHGALVRCAQPARHPLAGSR